jgi:tripartite-type tricarboxylate transporter receptor subunit TctC
MSAAPHIKTGRVKAIAVATERRIHLGRFTASQWVGVAVPVGTPRAVIEQANRTPEEMMARMRTESAQFARIVHRIGLKLD